MVMQMRTYVEPTSGVKLTVPEHWVVDVGANESVAVVAQATEEYLAGVNVVVTVEAPPEELQDLQAYTATQVESLRQRFAKQNFVLLGEREYFTETEEVSLVVHSRVQNKAVLACFQLFTLVGEVATAVTVTVPLALADTGFSLSTHIIQTFSPATRLYHFPFYED
ncbi:hypothetical protein IDM48_10870 [Rothia amarae]|uniref:DUF1795 domain-containing protein n=1 Tax=Rothia amarae TaxID=169480 RepID=A0A7H2BJI7_9MICC|nr:hypothetical protein [Rothia amarae]QNV39811.1 hypothetical protein IDM48_10760 [Rothia amarae]QNV39833.1 hypothetical protein IDM48_10870 [Rothia amarae]